MAKNINHVFYPMCVTFVLPEQFTIVPGPNIATISLVANGLETEGLLKLFLAARKSCPPSDVFHTIKECHIRSYSLVQLT